ncbi:Xaa-Pro peptidase family protein [Roseivivax sp. THAF30]|uniref:M24 family metallopeptidase n=1 Tax=Roseivivax sp. THAF30 TaxID=2587852 RepID=UPI001268DA51|nr:M24 family metallopeptidase [Roseivivax sp. THAF30]QFT61769.1 Methionine aminopeptidase [Roseivivax sp. THAF30]
MTSPRTRPPAWHPGTFDARWQALQRRMHDARLDALIVSNLANLRYLTGHAPIIGVAPTRPWYAVLPADGAPVVVVPQLGQGDMEREGAFGSLRSWSSPRPDTNEGVDEVGAVLANLRRRHGRIGAELGRETRIGTTWDDMTAIRDASGTEMVDASDLLWAERASKSDAELARIAAAAAATQDTFDCLPVIVAAAETERDVHRAVLRTLIESDAGAVPYLAIGSGPGGYDSLTRGATNRSLAQGDVLGVDIGTTIDGYWSDFDRNLAIGHPDELAQAAHRAAQTALDHALATVRPGISACDVWQAMAAVLPADGSGIGRLGHGVGLDYTEPPSLHLDDATPLRTGMVLAIEPSFTFETASGRRAVMVCEELIVVGDDGSRLLSRRADVALPVVSR